MQESDEERLRRMVNGAAQDRAQAGAADLTRLGTDLYKGFLDGGLPERLAATLVRDWFYLQMHRAMYGPQTPMTPSWDIRGADRDSLSGEPGEASQ